MSNIGQQNDIVRNLYRVPKRAWIGLAGLVILFIFGTWLVYTLSLHIVNIDPPLNNFSDLAPAIYIDFNYPIKPQGIIITFSPFMKTSYTVNGKQLVINLYGKLVDGQKFTFQLNNISSTNGKRLGKTPLQFTVKNVPYSELSQNLQQAVMAGQDKNVPQSKNTFIFTGTDELINQGLSSFQLDALRQAVFLFGQSKHQTISEAAIDQPTVQMFLPESGSSSNVFTMKFSMTINQTKYEATVLYQETTVLQLQLYNPANGSLLYDSGTIDDSEL